MRRYIYKMLTLATIILILSCESYLIHGNLDGFWQVTSIEDKQSGNITYCKGDTYYSFQRELVLVSFVSPEVPTGQMKENYIAYFSYNNDSIAMTDFRIYHDPDGSQAPLAKLEKFGLYETFNTFFVEKLSNSSLILNSKGSRIVLKKY